MQSSVGSLQKIFAMDSEPILGSPNTEPLVPVSSKKNKLKHAIIQGMDTQSTLLIHIAIDLSDRSGTQNWIVGYPEAAKNGFKVS